MLIVGELINASRKRIGTAIENGDKDTIQQIAREQFENGADFIDVNAGVFVAYIQHLKNQVFINFFVLFSRPQQFGPIIIQPRA